MPRFPQITVRLRTENPYALVAAVRHELRRAGVDALDIERFSAAALATGDASEQRRVCSAWVHVAGGSAG